MISIRRILPLCLALVLAAACSRDDTLVYGDTAIGNVSGGRILTDTGLTYVVAEKTCTGSLDTLRRAIVSCDILRKVSAKEYEIRLNEIYRVLLKDPLALSKADPKIVGDDPIQVYTSWISGGYLNMSTVIAYKANSGVTHVINLVYDDSYPDGELNLTLLHNANGETYPEQDGLAFGKAFVSFPISDLLPEGMDKITANLSWRWHTSDASGALLPETKVVTSTITLLR